MKALIRFIMLPLLITLLPLIMGCSGSAGIIAEPAPNPINSYMDDSNDDLTPPEPVHYAEGHIPWGLWQFSYDDATGEIVPVLIRDASAHWNVTDYLQPPNCNDCLGLKVVSINKSMLKLNVSIKNPTVLTARDVRGILITDDANFTLANADAYTSLFDNGGAIVLNPFMAFAVDEPERTFLPGVTHTREYHIAYASWPPNFGNLLYAVDASWPANCKEPYDIDVETSGQLYDYGGSLEITVTALDWQDDVSKVAIFSDEVLGATTLLTKIDATHWHKTITNSLFAPAGTYRFRVQANSPNPADLSLSHYFNVQIDEGVCTADANNLPTEAEELAFGMDVDSIVCLPQDQSDFYTFTIPSGKSAQGKLDLAAHFTPTSMKLYDGSLELITSTSIVDGYTSIDLGAYYLLPDVYYVQVFTNNADDIVAYRLENNGSAFTPSYGPASSPWPVVRHDQRRTGKSENKISDRLAVNWMIKDASPAAGPVLGSDGVIYYTVKDPARLRAVYPSGKIKWEYDLGPASPAKDIAVGWDNIIYVPCGTSLKAIRPTGSLKWQFDNSLGTIEWAPLIRTDGHLVVGESGVGIHCIKPNNKKVIWKAGINTKDIIAGMALGDDGNIYVTFKGSKILCLYPVGVTKYAAIGCPSPLRPPVVDTAGVMYYPGSDNNLHAIPADGGTELWAYPTGVLPGGDTNTPVLSDSGTIYAYISPDSSLASVDTAGGNPFWTEKIGVAGRSNFTLDGNGILCAVFTGGGIALNDSSDGSDAGGYWFSYNYSGKPDWDFALAQNGKAYFLTQDGLVALHESPLPETPQLLGEIPTANADYSHVFFADLNGDNCDEVIIRNISNKELRVFNGATGLLLWDPIKFKYDNPWPSWAEFGSTAIGDFDDDGLGDIVTTTLGVDDVPRMYVFKGSTGGVLADITGDNVPSRIILYDVIGGPFYAPDGQLDITASEMSRLLVYDGNTYSLTIDLDMSPDGTGLLYWYESNGDDHPDPFIYDFNNLYGTLDGSLIAASMSFRWAVNDFYWPYGNIGAHVNDDGIPDCYVYTSHWHINVADGATGALMTTYPLSPLTLDSYGWQYLAAGDLDGDGYDELISDAYSKDPEPILNFMFMNDYAEDNKEAIWFSAPSDFDGQLLGPTGYSPIICDFDGNGYPDILTLRSVRGGPPDYPALGYQFAVYDGRYGSEMTNSGPPNSAIKKSFLSAGDMNGDDKLDFIIIEENKIKIYTLNTPIPTNAAERPWLHPLKNVRNNMCTGDDD